RQPDRRGPRVRRDHRASGGQAADRRRRGLRARGRLRGRAGLRHDRRGEGRPVRAARAEARAGRGRRRAAAAAEPHPVPHRHGDRAHRREVPGGADGRARVRQPAHRVGWRARGRQGAGPAGRRERPAGARGDQEGHRGVRGLVVGRGVEEAAGDHHACLRLQGRPGGPGGLRREAQAELEGRVALHARPKRERRPESDGSGRLALCNASVWCVLFRPDGRLHLPTSKRCRTLWPTPCSDLGSGHMRRTAVLVAATALGCAAGTVAVAAPAHAAAWTDVPSAALKYNGTLDRVDFGAKNAGWAVGAAGNIFGPQAKIMRWNGSSWVADTSPASFTPTDVAVADANNAWIIGYSLFGTTSLHWNGTKWNQVPYPLVGFPTAVSAAPDGTAYSIAGIDAASGGPSAILRWTGSGWVDPQVPLPPSSSITAVDVRSKNDVWLAGTTASAGASVTGLVMHFNGSTWKRIDVP